MTVNSDTIFWSYSICNVLALWPHTSLGKFSCHSFCEYAQNSLSHFKTLEMERKREAVAYKKAITCVMVSHSVMSELYNSMDCSPPGSYVHGILLTRTHWSGLPFPPPGNLHEPGMELASPTSPILSGRFMKAVTNIYSKFIKSSVSQGLWMCSSLGTIVWALDVRGDPRSQHTFSGSFLILLDGHLISLLYLVSDLESWSLTLPK